ncbi:hypothetical protein [Myceligenerans pegani]|nr:hypothetical protein [Myceligenerans sp. TRM 65318]
MRMLRQWLADLLVERGHDEPPGRLDAWDRRKGCPEGAADASAE